MQDRVACFTLLADPTAARAEDRVVGFAGVAYSGGVVPNHGWVGDMAIDLSSLSLPTADVPVLRNHDPDQIVGRARLSNDGQRLEIAEGRFSDVTEVGRETAALLGEGHPWALSVGINGRVESVDRSRPIQLNGRSMTVDAVFRKARVLELSFVPSGADPNAYAANLSSRHGTQPPQGAEDMNELEQARARIAELEAQNAALTAELDAARTEATTANAALAAASLARRNAQITALFGEKPELTEAQLGAYRGMSDEQFGAVEAALALARASADPLLFRQTVTSGAGGAAPASAYAPPLGHSVDPERAQLHAKAVKYQAEHNADYLTAISAVAQGA